MTAIPDQQPAADRTTTLADDKATNTPRTTTTPVQRATGHVGPTRRDARTPARRPANGPARLSRRYPGRDRLDAADSDLRRAFATLAREAAVAADETVATQLAGLLDQVVAELKRATAAADAALLASARSQADLRRELDKVRAAANRTPAGRARTLYDRQIKRLGAMLLDAGQQS